MISLVFDPDLVPDSAVRATRPAEN